MEIGIGFTYRDLLCRVSDTRGFHMHTGLGSFHGTGMKTKPGLQSSGYNFREFYAFSYFKIEPASVLG